MGGLVSMSTRHNTTAPCSGVHWTGALDESWPLFVPLGLVLLDLAGVFLWLDSLGLSPLPGATHQQVGAISVLSCFWCHVYHSFVSACLCLAELSLQWDGTLSLNHL